MRAEEHLVRGHHRTPPLERGLDQRQRPETPGHVDHRVQIRPRRQRLGFVHYVEIGEHGVEHLVAVDLGDPSDLHREPVSPPELLLAIPHETDERRRHLTRAEDAHPHGSEIALRPPDPGRGRREVDENARDLIGVEEKCVVPVGGTDLVVANRSPEVLEHVGPQLHLGRGVEIVRADPDHERVTRDPIEGADEIPAPEAHVVEIHGPAVEKVRVGIEPLRDSPPVMAKPRLHVEHPAIAEGLPRLLEPVAAELLLQPHGRAVAEHADAAGDHLPEPGDDLVLGDVELDPPALEPVEPDLVR